MDQKVKNITNPHKKIKHQQDKNKNKESYLLIQALIYQHNMVIVQK